MNLKNAIIILEILTFLEGATFVQNSHVQNSKFHIDEGKQNVNDFVVNERHIRRHSNIWRPRRRVDVYFTGWSAWSQCDSSCKRHRERYCKVKRKCGFAKHIEENRCRRCPPSFHQPQGLHSKNYKQSKNRVININQIQLPVFQEIHSHTDGLSGSGNDFYMLKSFKRGKLKSKGRQILPGVNDYDDMENGKGNDFDPEDVYHSKKKDEISQFQNKSQSQKNGKRNLGLDTDYMEYDELDLEEFPTYHDDDYEEYEIEENSENKNTSRSSVKEKAVADPVPRHRRIYSKWSKWTKCSPKCTTRRYKKCRIKEQCGREVLREIAYCYTEGSFCQQWLNAQLQKSQPYEVRPSISRRKDTVGSSNSIAGDFIMSGKGYRGPEYTPLKLKCGIAAIKSLKRNVYSMLKIIGGRAARKGEWPWQVAILNRFKEAFCGGTLIAPQWILTAAHCVRKVLYVKLGEHNLYHDDGTELQYRVTKSFKHPNFDKKTVDSDIALLRLPKPVNATTWVGFSCLPRPFQALPRDMECTVIGWGKRRSRDQSGTNVLHQAEVPIIGMENCRSVYYDYTITKNMFCAGHKQGRIDTCAGDSGGPLLCRDRTKANHPWTIFGITSFGDGCAKRNKFGIYAKVSNYVDWIWSVVNCNGNCKAHTPKRY